MKLLAVVSLVLGAAITIESNPEPQLLTGLLGGGGQSNTVISAGGSQGLLGSTGLLGNILVGPNSLLNGVLNSLGGNEGVLNILLGNQGILKGLLDPKSGLVAGLLGGPNGGLLKGLLDSKTGLLGGVVELLDQVFCLLEKHGLGIVLKLLQVVKIDQILGLNEICKADGGNNLLSLVFKNVLSLPLVNEVVCLVNSLGIRPVLQLMQRIGVGKLIGLSDIKCSGVPIVEVNSTTSDILSQLLASLKISDILSTGLDPILTLVRELSVENLLDIPKTVSQVLCLVKNGLRLNVVVSLFQQLGADVLLNITKAYCKDGQLLFGDLIKSTGLPLDKLLGQVGCLLNNLGLGGVRQLLGQLNLPLIAALNSACSAPGVGGILGPLLQGGLSAIEPVVCLLKSLPVVGDVVKLLEQLGLEKFLFVGNLTCQGGSSTLDLSSILGLVTDLTSSLNLDLLLDLNLADIVDLKAIIESLNGVLDVKGLLNSVLCLVNDVGLKVVVDLLKQFGVTDVVGFNEDYCPAVNGTSGGGVLSVLLKGLGENVLFDLLKTLGVPQLLQLAEFIIKDGKLLDVAVLDNLLCILSAAGLQPVFDLLKKVGLDKVLGILDFFCVNGQPVRLNNTLDIFAETVIECQNGNSAQCTASFEALFEVRGCADICPNCDALQPYSVGAQAECKTACSLNNCVDVNGDINATGTSG